MRKFRALIVDDEPLARRTLRLLLSEDRRVTIAGESGEGTDAIRQILEKSPDILFLDVQMPGMTGFDVLEAVGADAIQVVIFVTAYDRYALSAFDAGALDYLLKPFDDNRFRRSLERAIRSLQRGGTAEHSRRLAALIESMSSRAPGKVNLAGGPSFQNHRLLVKSGGKMIVLKEEQIDWIAAADYCVMIHAADAKYVHRESMEALLKRLNPTTFARIHRSTIVNLDRVREVRPSMNGDFIVVLHDGTRLRLSRSRRHLLRAIG
ncbi:MAG TPA: LytTR family DNA-binding domain-containing protein [Bacteroidota bacterium]|nr:LytTR family DNA-binding domain-containing protein [Bacteroidota bacterium]